MSLSKIPVKPTRACRSIYLCENRQEIDFPKAPLGACGERLAVGARGGPGELPCSCCPHATTPWGVLLLPTEFRWCAEGVETVMLPVRLPAFDIICT